MIKHHHRSQPWELLKILSCYYNILYISGMIDALHTQPYGDPGKRPCSYTLQVLTCISKPLRPQTCLTLPHRLHCEVEISIRTRETRPCFFMCLNIFLWPTWWLEFWHPRGILSRIYIKPHLMKNILHRSWNTLEGNSFQSMVPDNMSLLNTTNNNYIFIINSSAYA